MSDASTTAELGPDLMGSLAHELRHEVSAVLHQVQLLRAGALDESTRQRSLAAIESNAESLMGFVDALDELGRIGRGEVTPACRQIDIDELIGASAQDRARPLDWTAPLAGGTEGWSAFADPLIVDHIVTGVLGQYRDQLDEAAQVSAYAQHSIDRYIDVVFTSHDADRRPTAPFRAANLADGLPLFVAGRAAELMGATLGVVGAVRNGTYLLRLPQAGYAPSS